MIAEVGCCFGWVFARYEAISQAGGVEVMVGFAKRGIVVTVVVRRVTGEGNYGWQGQKLTS